MPTIKKTEAQFIKIDTALFADKNNRPVKVEDEKLEIESSLDLIRIQTNRFLKKKPEAKKVKTKKVKVKKAPVVSKVEEANLSLIKIPTRLFTKRNDVKKETTSVKTQVAVKKLSPQANIQVSRPKTASTVTTKPTVATTEQAKMFADKIKQMQKKAFEARKVFEQNYPKLAKLKNKDIYIHNVRLFYSYQWNLDEINNYLNRKNEFIRKEVVQFLSKVLEKQESMVNLKEDLNSLETYFALIDNQKGQAAYSSKISREYTSNFEVASVQVDNHLIVEGKSSLSMSKLTKDKKGKGVHVENFYQGIEFESSIQKLFNAITVEGQGSQLNKRIAKYLRKINWLPQSTKIDFSNYTPEQIFNILTHFNLISLKDLKRERTGYSKQALFLNSNGLNEDEKQLMKKAGLNDAEPLVLMRSLSRKIETIEAYK